MPDKLKQGISVVPTFVDGEQPEAAKLNSLGAQLRHAAAALEAAVGDIHGQSWPYSPSTSSTLSQAWGRSRDVTGALTLAAERQLDIANLARFVGPASNLNPRMLGGSASVEDTVPVGVHEFSLRFRPEGALSGAHPAFSDNTVAFITAQFKATPSDIAVAGDYSVTEAGKVYCVTTSTVGTAVYNTDPSEWAGGMNPQEARFNVMPDPNQIAAGGTGVAITGPDVNGRYTCTLPSLTHQQSNHAGDSITLADADINSAGVLRMPVVLSDNYTAGQELPAGIVYLKNETTKEVYESGVYSYLTELAVYVSNVDLTAAVAAGDDFSILTVGTDMTTAIDDLRVKGFHTHDRSFGEPLVPVTAISDILAEPGVGGAFTPSAMASNFASQYLHRDGLVGSENKMLGLLVTVGGMRGDTAGTVGDAVSIWSDSAAKTLPGSLPGTMDITSMVPADIQSKTVVYAVAIVTQPVSDARYSPGRNGTFSFDFAWGDGTAGSDPYEITFADDGWTPSGSVTVRLTVWFIP